MSAKPDVLICAIEDSGHLEKLRFELRLAGLSAAAVICGAVPFEVYRQKVHGALLEAFIVVALWAEGDERRLPITFNYLQELYDLDGPDPSTGKKLVVVKFYPSGHAEVQFLPIVVYWNVYFQNEWQNQVVRLLSDPPRRPKEPIIFRNSNAGSGDQFIARRRPVRPASRDDSEDWPEELPSLPAPSIPDKTPSAPSCLPPSPLANDPFDADDEDSFSPSNEDQFAENARDKVRAQPDICDGRARSPSKAGGET